MSKSEIYHNIRYYENEIASYQYQIRKLKNKLSKLQSLHQKYNALQTNFGSRQSLRKSKLSSLSTNNMNVKLVRHYYGGMSDLLGGSYFNQTYSGLDEAKSRICSSMNIVQNKIDSLQDAISSCERRIDRLYDELNEIED